jgi:hypothetical protein
MLKKRKRVRGGGGGGGGARREKIEACADGLKGKKISPHCYGGDPVPMALLCRRPDRSCSNGHRRHKLS